VVDKLLGNVVGLVTKIDSVNFLADGIEKQSKSRNKKTQKKDLMNDPNNEEAKFVHRQNVLQSVLVGLRLAAVYFHSFYKNHK
jgi:hypothetical protein